MHTIVKSIRVPFLLLTPACVFLAYATAATSGAQIAYFDLFLVLGAALLAHISVNTFNEYYDFRSGLDAKTVKTPFSGGSGALIANPAALDAVFYVALISLAVTMLIGVYFTVNLGLLILPLGITGVLLIVTYTNWINRSPLLCLIAPGLGFGPVMVMGSHVVLTGEYTAQAFLVSMVPFFLVNNLLLLNQYPDISADQSIGRRHFPIVHGTSTSTVLYGVMALAAYVTIGAGIYIGLLPGLSVIALLPLLLATIVFVGATKHAATMEKLIPYMGMNVAATLLTPILLGLAIIYG